jgi:PHD/YefM family antitoxin component YafN of YafNO toxin-antitoxin module
MYSSTQLIRHSKSIFNKIIDKEINKAIIFRDGKPSFILLDFEKYESIMAKFELKNDKKIKPQSKQIKKTIQKIPQNKEKIQLKEYWE